MSRIRKSLMCSLAVLWAGVCPAVTTNVSTVAELVGALRAWNNSTYNKSSHTMVLKAGSYDLTDYAEDFYFAGYKVMTNINNRIGISGFTLRGETDNPRDTVLYCRDGDTNGRALLYNYAGLVRDLTVSNVVCSGRGGGIFNHNGNSLCSNVVVTACSGTSGGGMIAGTLTDCRIENCTATEYGGGVYSSAKLYGCTIESCTSGKDGGAAHGAALTDCTIRNCTSPQGGGAHSCTLTNCTVTGCSATNGGGVSGSTVYGGIVSNNTATVVGGGLYALSGGAEKCLIVDNEAGTNGGGVHSSVLTDCKVVGNVAAESGGGVYGTTGKIAQYLLTDCVVSNNQVRNEDANATLSGGGVSYATMLRGRVTMNLVSIDAPEKYAYGGGTYNCSLDGVTVDGNAVTGTCKNTQGGGDYGSTLTQCKVMNNISQTLGSGVCNGTATDCIISNNASLAKNGDVRGVRLSGCTVYGVSVDPQGKAVVDTRICGYTNGNAIARGANVIAPDADLHVAGSTHLVTSQGTFTNCLFAGHNLTTQYAGLFGAGKADTVLSSCTVADNRTPYMQAGFTDKSGVKFAAINSVFSDNFTDGGAPADLRSSYPNVQFTNCLIKKLDSPSSLDGCNFPCTGCITGKGARFCREGDDPYRLRTSSPAVGMGLYQDWMASATDIRRNPEFPRSVDGKVDMGCYQGAVAGPGLLLFLR